jgi:hypothetical protein
VLQASILGGEKKPLFEKSGAKTFFMLGYGRFRDNAHGPA